MIVEGKRKAEWFLGRKLDPQKYKGKKFYVLSESGERLFGGYKTKKEAKKRLGQVEFFKRQKNPLGGLGAKSSDWVAEYIWSNTPGRPNMRRIRKAVQDNGQWWFLDEVDTHGDINEDLSSVVTSGPEDLSKPIVLGLKGEVLDGRHRVVAAWESGVEVLPAYVPAQWLHRRHKDKLPGGLADSYSPSDFDPRALAKGMKVEFEHTRDPRIAREIAMDHLAEHPDYYDALEKMERELEENPTPVDDKLYKRVVREAKKKFDVWPSIYASSWVVQEYKRRGGTYENPSGLQKWFDEEWVDLGRSIDKKGRVKKWVQCGRPDADKGAYPKCVPLAKAKKMTPKQRLSAVRRKRSAEKSAKDKKGRAPVMVSTFKQTARKNPEVFPVGMEFETEARTWVVERSYQGTVDRKKHGWTAPEWLSDTYAVELSGGDKPRFHAVISFESPQDAALRLYEPDIMLPASSRLRSVGGTGYTMVEWIDLPFRENRQETIQEALKIADETIDSRDPEGSYRKGNPGGLAKDVKKLLKYAEKQGCRVFKGRKHYKVRCPQGRQFTVAASPSDYRALQNIRRDFRNIAGIQMNPQRKVLYIKPNKAAIKAAKRGLEAREKAPKSKKGGLDAMQAKEAGVGSGVLRARDIIAGKRVNAYQVKAFFDRHRGNYLKAKDKRLKPEESRAIQAWLIWGGDPLYKQVKSAVEKDKKKRAKNPALPLPLANPKKFWDKDHNWNQVLINKSGKRKTRKQILDYYLKNEKKIWPFLKGQTVMIIFGRGRNDFVLRRKGPDGKYIKLTKLKGIDDPNSFEYWIHRRAIEFHPVITTKTTGLVWIDIDPYKKARKESMAKMQRQIRKSIPLMKRLLKDEFGVQKSYVWKSGKADGGWHIEGNLPRKMNVDKLRKKLRKALDEYFGEDPTFTTGIAKPGQIRLDTTLTKTLGSLRAPFSYTVDGGQKLPVDIPGLAKPKSKYRKTAKRNVELTEEEYAEAKDLIEVRQQPPFNPIGYGGNRMVYLIELEGREPFALKADQGFKGTRLQTMDEVQNIQTIDNPLLPEIYDHDEKNYRWVEMELLDALEDDSESREIFEKISGMDWKDFDVTVWGLSQGPSEKDIEEVQAKLVKNKRGQVFFGMIADLWDEGLSPREMSILPNWGVTKDGKLKYLDVGA